MDRKKKLKIFQILLLIFGSSIIFFTYWNFNNDENLLSDTNQKKIQEQLEKKSKNENGDFFINIQYNGIDLAGNRYVLKSKEAYNSNDNKEIVNMKFVDAVFYFKDGTILYIVSEEGIYNNKTLDMTFKKNVEAKYQGSELYAGMANYSNSKSFLTISENVKVKDKKGTVFAEKLLFDVKNQTLDIASKLNDKVKTKVEIK